MQILNLRESDELGLVGGKAVNLSSLMQAGINVPDGFVITTSAVTHLSQDLSAKVLKHFDELGSPFVAVRSSATAEDGRDNSWAGQFDTYLFVNRDHLIQNVQKCQESALSLRTSVYRSATKSSVATTEIAVIVQTMVPAEVSGICFSVHPITQNSDQLILEVAYGLGEPVVSGNITPDTYIFSRQLHDVMSKSVANQLEYMKFSEEAGKTTWATSDHPSNQKLSDSQIKILASEVERIENHFGYPVDVEWALYKNEFYILQSRPITTLG